MSKHIRLMGLLAALVGVLFLIAAPAEAQSSTWLAQFWNNTSLSALSVVTRFDSSIDYDWGYGSRRPA
ncbi:MAG: hypothetical protein R3C44_21255 [Chloroflexota bacterium]